MTQTPFNVQYQGSVRAQGFEQEQTPDVTSLLRQNQQTEQQNFQNLSQAWARMPKSEGLTALADFSQTLTNTLVTAAKEQNERQKAEGISLFYEDQAAQQKALAEHQTQVTGVQAVDQAATEVAADALKQGVPFEVADKLKSLSGWKKYGYAQATALSAGQGYKSWMLTQLQNNKEQIVLNAGTPEERIVNINSQDLNVAESAAVRAHLRTKYLQESGLANLSAGLQAQAFQPMHTTDAELHGLARKEYAIRKSGEDEQAYIRQYSIDKKFGTLITNLTSLVDSEGRPYGTAGAWKRVQQLLTDRALSGEDVNWDDIYKEEVPWAKGKTFGQLYGQPGQRLNVIETDIAKAKIAFYKQEEAFNEMEKDKLVDKYAQDLRSREGGFTLEDIERLQKDLVRRGHGRSDKLTELGATLSLDAEQTKTIDKQAEQLYNLGMLTTDFTRTMPPTLFRKWQSLAEAQQQALQVPESKVHLDGISNHVKATTNASSVKNLGGTDTLIIGELQRKYKQTVAKMVATGQFVDPIQAHNAAYEQVINEYNVGYKTKGNRYFYQNGFPNYMTQIGAKADARAANQWLLDRYSRIKAAGGITRALDQPNLIMSNERLDQVVQSYGTPSFQFPPEAMHFAQQYNISPLTILNKQLKAAGKPQLAKPSTLQVFKENKAANDALINRYPTVQRSARYTADPSTWQLPTSQRPSVMTFNGQGMKGILGMIRSGEGSYTSMYPSESYPQLTNMTIQQVVNFQKQKLRDGRASAAVGAYQFLSPELAARMAGLPLTAKFTPENQDKMAIAYMIGTKRPALAAYITGKSKDINAAHQDIANEWAALEGPSGRGAYDKDGYNKASIRSATVRKALMEARRAYLAGQRG